MNRRLFRCASASLLVLLTFVFGSPGYGEEDGIYADFATSMGGFTCRLDYTNAPKAVANFVGLAMGQRAWLDLPSGHVTTNAFYNGLTFHRVIAGFVIQAGSPNGLGTDGPGYAFLDEFTPALRHDGFGVLSMANSGPDSNGSQFFVAVSAQPQLNDVHTIFGRLTSGSNVVYAINQVATDANAKPLTNVIIQTVSVRQVGALAQAFDFQAQGLPVVTNRDLSIAKGGATVSLAFSNNLYADNRLYSSTNLAQWTGTGLGIELATPVPNTILLAANERKRFFRLAQVQYPSSTLAPKNVLGRTLRLFFSNGWTITNVFDLSGGAAYTSNAYPPGTAIYTWRQEPYRGRLSPILFSTNALMNLRLDFTSLDNGTFAGSIYPYTPVMDDVAGSFALTGP